MHRYKLSAFASSPLITPERLKANCAEALAALPPWADTHALAQGDDPTLEVEHQKVAFHVRRSSRAKDKREGIRGGNRDTPWGLTAVFIAILAEVTRYGNSVNLNPNRGKERLDALFHLELALSGDGYEHFPVGRLINNATAKREVKLSTEGHFRHDLHPANLTEVEGGKPKHDARAVAIRHAQRRAEKASLPAAEVKAYVDNLYALFVYHDELYGLARSDY